MNTFTLPERGLLCSALNKTFPNGLRATSETIQFFTLRQMQMACLSYEPAKHLLERFTNGTH